MKTYFQIKFVAHVTFLNWLNEQEIYVEALKE